jgi:hypothetical protein
MVSLVFGGGKYGIEAVEYLKSKKKPFVVVDVDSSCHVRKKYDLPKVRLSQLEEIDHGEGYFIEGGVYEALKIYEKLKPELVFPTAPIHLSASLVQEKHRYRVWNEGVDFLLSGLPPRVIVSSGRGSVVVTYNRDEECQPYCSAPDVCPVTGIKKPTPMYRLLEFAVRDGFVVRSHQLKPGIGALKGEEIDLLMKWAEGKDRLLVGTACRCHGVVTALKR